MKKVLTFICCAVLIFSLVSCGNTSNPTPDKDNVSTEASNSQKRGNLNLLTGTYDLPDNAVGKRPVSVMINNIHQALPQYGISEADIIYEAPAEGGITRLMAIFSDYTKVPKVGPIRSARDYYLDFAAQYDTIFVNWGTSDIAANVIKNKNIDNIDGMYYAKYFYTDSAIAAKKGVEHSRFLQNDGLLKAIEKKGNRLDSKVKDSTFKFVAPEEEYVPSEQQANYIQANFSSGYDATFDYDSSSKKYMVSEFDKPHMDAGANKQLAFDNVIIIYSDVDLIAGGNGKVEVDLTKGEGVFATRGGVQNINWKKGAFNSPFVFTDSANKQITLNPGKTYICVVPKTQQKSTIIKSPTVQ